MPATTVLPDLIRLAGAWCLTLALGLLWGRAVGLRRCALVLSAAPLSYGSISLLAMLQPLVPIPWRPINIAISMLILLGIVTAARLRLGRRGLLPDGTQDDSGMLTMSRWALVALGATTLVVGGVLLAACGGSFSTVSQTWDATTHTNMIRGIYELGSASPWDLRLAAFGAEGVGAFYPTGFAAFASFVGQSVGAEAVTASNIASVLIGGLIWPSTVTLLVRQVFGATPRHTMLSLALALGTWAMPYSPMSFGVLWPTMSAYALVPLMIAAALRTATPLLGSSRIDIGACCSLLLAAILIAISQPRILLIAALFVWIVLLAVLVGAWRQGRMRGDRASSRRALWLITSLLAILTIGLLLSRHLEGKAFQYINWPIIESPIAIVYRALVNATTTTYPGLLVAVLTWVGVVVAIRQPRLWWLPTGYIAVIVLEAVTATNRNDHILAVTRFWYADRWRIVPMLPVFSVALSVLGLSSLIDWSLRGRSSWRRRAAMMRRPGRAIVGCLAIAIYALVIADIPQRISRLSQFYISAALDPERSLVSPREAEYFHRLTDLVPADATILNNPADGSAFIYAYSGRRVTFPAPNYAGLGPSTWLRSSLIRVRDHAVVCRALSAAGVTHVFNGGQTFHTAMFEPTPAPGMQIPKAFWATTPVAVDGDLRLYKITGCKDGIPIR